MASQTPYEYQRIVMGSPCRLVLYAANKEQADRAAQTAFLRMGRLEESLSDWMPLSEVRQLPEKAGVTVKLSADLNSALAASLKIASMTDGAFDPTVGPLTKRWRAARKSGTVLAPEECKAYQRRIGWQKIEHDAARATFTARVDGIELDFGGIGQGLGADLALISLRESGVASALIDLSGDIVVGDPPPGKEAWIIDLDDAQHTKIALVNAAITTSGDRFQRLEVAKNPSSLGLEESTRQSHIIDPRTTLPLTNRVEVVVIAANGQDADSWATALSVLGPTAGNALLASQRTISARWTYEQADSRDALATVISSRWPQPAVIQSGQALPPSP